MNYLLHFNGEVPNYAEICMQTISNIDPDSKIYFITDQDFKSKYSENINSNDITFQYIKELKEIDYFEGEQNPLWNTSLLRIFYLHNASKLLKIDSFVHFDLDVLIFKAFKDLKENFQKNKLNITPVNENFLIFGYSYVDGLKNYSNVCSKILEILENANFYEKKYYNNNKLNEMVLLNIAYIENPDMFNILNTIPDGTSSILFDGISYGQYLGGIDKKRFSKKSINIAHYAGRSMQRKGFRPKFKSSRPYIEYNNKIYEIANLHIHKKNLLKFIPSQ